MNAFPRVQAAGLAAPVPGVAPVALLWQRMAQLCPAVLGRGERAAGLSRLSRRVRDRHELLRVSNPGAPHPRAGLSCGSRLLPLGGHGGAPAGPRAAADVRRAAQAAVGLRRGGLHPAARDGVHERPHDRGPGGHPPPCGGPPQKGPHHHCGRTRGLRSGAPARLHRPLLHRRRGGGAPRPAPRPGGNQRAGPRCSPCGLREGEGGVRPLPLCLGRQGTSRAP